MPSLESLPIELTGEVCAYLNCPDDVLSLALTSRATLHNFRRQGQCFFRNLITRVFGPDHIGDLTTIVRIRQLKRTSRASWKDIEDGILTLSQSTIPITDDDINDITMLDLLVLQSQVSRLVSDYAHRAWRKAQMLAWVHGSEFLPSEHAFRAHQTQMTVLSVAEATRFHAAFLALELYCQTFFFRGRPLFADRHQRSVLSSLLCSKAIWIDSAPRLLRKEDDSSTPWRRRTSIMYQWSSTDLAKEQFLSARSYFVHQHKEVLSLFRHNQIMPLDFRLTGPLRRYGGPGVWSADDTKFGNPLSATSFCWDSMQLNYIDEAYFLRACSYGIGTVCSFLDCNLEGKRTFYEQVRYRSAGSTIYSSSPASRIFLQATHQSKQRGFASAFWDAQRLKHIGLTSANLEHYKLVARDNNGRGGYKCIIEEEDPYYSPECRVDTKYRAYSWEASEDLP